MLAAAGAFITLASSWAAAKLASSAAATEPVRLCRLPGEGRETEAFRDRLPLPLAAAAGAVLVLRW